MREPWTKTSSSSAITSISATPNNPRTNALKFEQEASHITTLGLSTANGPYDTEVVTKRASYDLSPNSLTNKEPGPPKIPSEPNSLSSIKPGYQKVCHWQL
jgi:hypothetical protein